MAKPSTRARAGVHRRLQTHVLDCPDCHKTMGSAYSGRRTVVTLDGAPQLQLRVRCCPKLGCKRYHRPYRPEEEGRRALPAQEFGLDVLALVGARRYRQHRRVPEIHGDRRARGLDSCERTVTNLLDRYDELLAVRRSDSRRLRRVLAQQGRGVRALDGLQPDVGHEVLWVIRACRSGQGLLARSLLSSSEGDWAALLSAATSAWGESVVLSGVISEGQPSIRNAVARALPGVPHPLGPFPYLREAARPIYELDRPAKKELKKRVRGIRPLERGVEDQTDAQAQAVLGYGSAVRWAITDDGRPPLEARGLKLQERLTASQARLDRVEEKGGYPPNGSSARGPWNAPGPKPPPWGPA